MPDISNVGKTEDAVLCVILNDPDALVAIADVLPDAGYFSQPRNAQVYRAIQALARLGIPPNPATVAEHLGWPLVDVQRLAVGYNAGDAQAVVYLAEIVSREGQRRLLHEAGRNIMELAATPTDDVVGLAATALNLVAGTSLEFAQRRDTSVAAALQEVDQLIARIASTSRLGYAIRPKWLNDRIYGLSANSVIVISGPSGGRKTTLAQNLVIDALRGGARLSYFALEGSADLVAANLLAMLAVERLLAWNMPEQAFLSSKFLLFGNRTASQQRALEQARQELESWRERLFIYDGRDGIYDPDGVMLKMRRDHMLHQMDVAVVDYLQLMGSPGLKDYEALLVASRAMQRITRELHICSILLAQLNSSSVFSLGGDDNNYYGSGIKGGDQAQQDADYLLRVYPRKEDSLSIKLELRKARFARDHVSTYFTVNEQSGWITGEA